MGRCGQDDAGAAAGGEAGVVVAAMRELGWECAYCVPVPASACPEPVVVSAGDFAVDSRQADGSVRGVRELTVTVCRDDPHDAEVSCLGAAIDLEGVDWGSAACPDGMSVVEADVGIPTAAGRDGSGRWLWELPVAVTSVRGPR